MRNLFSILIVSVLLMLNACKPDVKPDIVGCTDPGSVNYNAAATVDDNSCKYPSDLFEGRWVGTFYTNGVVTFPQAGTSQLIDEIRDSVVFQLNKINNTTLQQQDTTITFSANKDSLFKTINSDITSSNVRIVKYYHFLGIISGDSLYTTQVEKETDTDLSSGGAIIFSSLISVTGALKK